MSRIVDQYGNPIDRGVLREPQTSRVGALRNQYLVGQIGRLTPVRLAETLKSADNGDLLTQHRLFADMEERDAHLAAEIAKRKLALLGLDWSIVPPRGASAAEKKHAEWLTEILTDAVDPIEDLILAAMDGVGHGFAAIELEWRREGNALLPAFYPRPQEWFRLDMTRREIRLRDPETPDGAPLVPFGWVFHTHGKAKTGYMGRLGLHRVLVWPYLYKAYAIVDFAEFLETFGLPIIVGKYFSGASPEEKSTLMRAVTELGHNARAIMPIDMQLEIQKITGGGGDTTPHLAMIDWCERSESKSILGQTMSAESKSTGLGSSNADLHREVRRDILEADAREIAGTLTRDLLYPLIALNRGGIDGLARCPRFVFDTGDAEDIKLFADALPKLVGAGMKIPVAWAHEKLKIPVPVDDEEILSVAAPEEADEDGAPEPEKKAPALAALSALSRAEKTALENEAADEIDALADAMADEWEPALSPLVESIKTLLEKSETLEEFRAALASLPEAGMAALTERLARGLFAARVSGRAFPPKKG